MGGTHGYESKKKELRSSSSRLKLTTLPFGGIFLGEISDKNIREIVCLKVKKTSLLQNC